MYLMINGTKHTVSRRILTGDTVKYLSVTPEPVDVSGLISMYRDDGFLLCADDAAGYERTVYNGTILTLTNAPEPEPQPEPKPVWHATQAQMDASVKLASMSVTAMSLTPDETITVAALYPDWTDGTYEVGDIRLALGQPWNAARRMIQRPTRTSPRMALRGGRSGCRSTEPLRRPPLAGWSRRWRRTCTNPGSTWCGRTDRHTSV